MCARSHTSGDMSFECCLTRSSSSTASVSVVLRSRARSNASAVWTRSSSSGRSTSGWSASGGRSLRSSGRGTSLRTLWTLWTLAMASLPFSPTQSTIDGVGDVNDPVLGQVETRQGGTTQVGYRPGGRGDAGIAQAVSRGLGPSIRDRLTHLQYRFHEGLPGEQRREQRHRMLPTLQRLRIEVAKLQVAVGAHRGEQRGQVVVQVGQRGP